MFSEVVELPGREGVRTRLIHQLEIDDHPVPSRHTGHWTALARIRNWR